MKRIQIDIIETSTGTIAVEANFNINDSEAGTSMEIRFVAKLKELISEMFDQIPGTIAMAEGNDMDECRAKARLSKDIFESGQ